MSFLFGRARSRAAADLPRQAREHVLRLEGPNSAAKVRSLDTCFAISLADNFPEGSLNLQGRRAIAGFKPNENCPTRNTRYVCLVFPRSMPNEKTQNFDMQRLTS